MLKYRWYARTYGWTPAQVDDLWEDEDHWIPLVEEAWAEVDRLTAAAQAQKHQPGR
jgi:hypothetical protein